ncbi:hypothetical protein OVA14_06955 [Agrococcus sp. SL85]|uniref:hypothetical protein n=1 Tax=Agrococcus sp. SL85 TaxID=2995141 RepID=UPI00226CA261|nr:hypothetical protein [Agrococcus sp. SL85]WAC65134.1 hypothetical protein OVA14_06955 [Agrococcus sp. SL85]
MLAAVAGGGAVAGASLGARPWLVALIALIALGLTWLAGSILGTRIEAAQTDGVISGTTRLAGERRRALDAGAVHVVRRLGPVGHGGVTRLLFYAGRARALTAARVRRADLAALQAMVVLAGPAAAARRASVGR